MNTKFIRLALFILFLLPAQLVLAQANIFRAGNVTIAGSTNIVYGGIADINDGNTNTDVEFTNPASKSVELLITCNNPEKVMEYFVNYYYNSQNATTLTLSGSQNNSTWTQIDTRTVSASATTISATFTNTVSYKYYKLVFANIARNSLDIKEIEAYNNDPVVSTLQATLGANVNTINLSWTKVIRNQGSYQLERSTNGTDFTLIYTGNTATATSYADTDRKPQTDYWYRVRAVINQVNQPYSPVVKVTDNLVGTPVLTAVPGNLSREIALSWTGLNFYSEGQYVLEKSTDGTNFTSLKTVDKAVLAYTDTTALRNTNYWYRVKAVNYKSASPYSNVAAVTSGNDVLTKAPTLAASAGNIGTVANLSWSGLTIYTPGQFQIERSSNGTDFTLLKTVDKSISSYADSTLTQATDYWYRVRGTNAVAPSPYSNVVKITTISDVLTAAPTLKVISPTGTQASLSWALSFVTPGGFELEKSTDGTNFTLMGKVDKAVLSYNEESLTPNTSYWYRVRAYNYVSKSPYSAVVKITTNGVTAMPADITDDGGSLTVSAENTGGSDGGEGSSKLIDNNIGTKWLVFSTQARGDLSAIYEPKGSYIVTGYKLGTAGDAPGRDPKNWRFEGSNDKLAWTVLDTRTNQLGGTTDRYAFFNFDIATPGTTAFKYYRIVFTANNGATDGVRFQVAEWQILGIDANAPEIPSNLTASNFKANSIDLAWTQSTTKPAAQFILQRSEDGLYYKPIDTLDGTAKTFTDANLYEGFTYYYRINAIGATATAVSGWSNVATGTTLSDKKPLSPKDLNLKNAGETTVSLAWTDRAIDETGYVLERSRDNTNFTAIKTLPANTTSYTDATVWPATVFYYRIRAQRDADFSPYSNVLSVTTGGINTPPSSAPLIYRKICTAVGTYRFSINGLSGGPGFENVQKLKVTGIKSEDLNISDLTFQPDVIDGVAYYGFKTTDLAKVGDSATIAITVKDDGGTINFGSDSTTFKVKIYFVPFKINITADKAVTNVPRYTLVNLTVNTDFPANTTFEWNKAEGIEGATNGIKLRVRPNKPTTYTVNATSASGCTATASITVVPQDSLVISNVLTPNADGKNDTWIIYGIQKYENNQVKVMDRQGRTVLDKKNYNNDWDGTFNGSALPQGGYYYVVETNDGSKPKTGVLMIVKQNNR